MPFGKSFLFIGRLVYFLLFLLISMLANHASERNLFRNNFRQRSMCVAQTHFHIGSVHIVVELGGTSGRKYACANLAVSMAPLPQKELVYVSYREPIKCILILVWIAGRIDWWFCFVILQFIWTQIIPATFVDWLTQMQYIDSVKIFEKPVHMDVGRRDEQVWPDYTSFLFCFLVNGI